jgi:hypothetical protein
MNHVETKIKQEDYAVGFTEKSVKIDKTYYKKGTIRNEYITIIKIYAPNTSAHKFIKNYT